MRGRFKKGTMELYVRPYSFLSSDWTVKVLVQYTSRLRMRRLWNMRIEHGWSHLIPRQNAQKTETPDDQKARNTKTPENR